MEQRDEKKQVLLEALEGAPTVFLHLDARREGVRVPEMHRGNAQLILRVGYMLQPPINIVLGDETVTCTLSFNRAPFFCELPWDAIYAIVCDDGRAAVWPDDIPPEAARMKDMVPQKPTPAAVQSEAPARPVSVPSPSTPATSLSGRKPSEPKGAAKRPTERRKEKPKPHAPTIRERSVNIRSGSAAAATPPSNGATTKDAAGDGPTSERETPPPAAERKPKRELPPYLRVIK